MSRRGKSTVPREFFLEETLYKALHRDRTIDEIECWDVEGRKRVILPYSYVREKWEKSYSLQETADLVWRSKGHLFNMVYGGEILPSATYLTFKTGERKGYRFSPRGVVQVWEFFAARPWGRPRKDGRIIPHQLPTKRELRAQLDQQVVTYIKNTDGEFIPTWKA